MKSKDDRLVLVTGGTGFLGAHCILQLLDKGFRVRASMRTLRRKNEAISMLRRGGVTSIEHLSFVEADLSNDANWDKAARDCDYILHVASPFPIKMPKDENELITPAVEGTVRVLKAASKAGVKRVVMTSSFAAVGYSCVDPNGSITEENWTDPNDRDISAYTKSKTLAELAAWDFVNADGNKLELSVICPRYILGPSLSASFSSSLTALKNLFDGTMKAVPNISYGIVDVRDVADLHIRAMTDPAAKNQRFLASSGHPMTFNELALFLRIELGDKAQNVTTKVLPNWVVRIVSLFNAEAKGIRPHLGKVLISDDSKAKRLLGWVPREREEAILSAIACILEFERESVVSQV